MNIDIIKNEFETIKELKFLIETLFKRMNSKIDYLKEMYNDYSEKHNNTDLVLTLDSFHFQTKFIETEYKNYYKIFKKFLNRLYCDYYKFYKYSYNSIINHIEGFSIKFNSKFPVYKDLEDKDYPFSDTIDIHAEIIKIVIELHSYLITLEHENKTHEVYSSYGINIDNLVTINNYKNIVLSEKIKLILNCLRSYSTFQSKFLERFSLKLKFIYAQTVADIRVEDNEVLENNLDRELLETLETPVKKEIVKIFNKNRTPSVSSESNNSDSDLEVETKSPVRTYSFSFRKLFMTTLFFVMLCNVSQPQVMNDSKALIILN